MVPLWVSALALAVALIPDAAIASAHIKPHSHAVRAPLPDSWHHPQDHPVNALFKRDGPSTDGAQYPDVGSPTWSAAYPTGTPDSKAMPQAWKDALNAAVQAGKIPGIAPSKDNGDDNPTYQGDPNGPDICSATYKCRIDGDVWDAPDGVFGASFDDGPLPSSDKLYAFLQQNNVHATHFFIGLNILQNPKEFQTAFSVNQGDIAVHTYTHPHMTTLSNEDVVAQLAWTMEIIHNSTGGRVPRFWRPPYGDTDKRVSAIAKEVLGLTTVVWNQDSEDWSMPTGTTPAKIHTQFQQWTSGSKSPGLVILEHELNDATVQAFIDNFPLVKSNGWNVVSIAQMDNANKPYQNGDGTTGAVTAADILANAGSVSANSSVSAAPASSGSVAPASSGSANTPASASTSGSAGATKSSSSSSSSGTSSSNNESKSSGANVISSPLVLMAGATLAGIAFGAGYLA
ncbi:glycoside hydrolase/deacetylase [Dentipellis sp. KUC8613]|nr:glycoside hydrolase/deacetylase [Dentipellis sp. KUC8613]